jgi:geranylgeranyl reductase family protein
MSSDYDVIVAGAGPAGSTAACSLAQAGYRVLVLGKKAFPRPKPCGGCLSRRVERLLPASILGQVVEDEITRARFYFHARGSWEVQTRQPAAYMVRRERFDSLLAQEAAKAGAVYSYESPLVSFETHDNRVEVKTPQTHHTGRYLVLAHGAYPLPSCPRLRPRGRLTYQALEGKSPLTAFRSPWPPGTVGIFLGHVSFGYGWVFPCRDQVSIGLCFLPKRERRPGLSLESFKEDLSPTLSLPRLKGHPLPCFDGRKRFYSKHRVVWTGDAAQLVDPFLGEGIYYALLSGQTAALAIGQALKGRQESLALYDQEVRRLITVDLTYALRLARWVYAAPRLFWWLLKKYPVIMDIYFDILRGHERYERFFWEIHKRVRHFSGFQWLLGEPKRPAPPETLPSQAFMGPARPPGPADPGSGHQRLRQSDKTQPPGSEAGRAGSFESGIKPYQ